MTKKDKMVLFLGSADTEAATSKLKAINKLYKRKMLESSVDNWSTIVTQFDEFNISCVVIKLTNRSFCNLASDEYSDVVNMLLQKVASTPSLILAHESLLTGIPSREFIPEEMPTDEWNDPYFNEYQRIKEYEFNSYYTPPSIEVIEKVKQIVKDYGLSIVPYNKNVELSTLVSSFIDKNENNLIFRIYVPVDRIWATEAEKLLDLFRDYLHKAAGLNARHDQYKTNNGVIHEFFGDDDVASASLSEKFNEFSGFMDACVQNPELAKTSLSSSNLNNSEVLDLVSKYSREARRLHIDLKHERERRLLNIKHELESELAEFVVDENDWSVLNEIIENSVPEATSLRYALGGGTGNLNQLKTPQNIYINSQIIEAANGVIAQEISGTVNLSSEAKDLIALIERHAGSEKTELVSAVHELVDDSARKTDRLSAKQKLKGFLISSGSVIGSLATGVLQTYIEKQIGL